MTQAEIDRAVARATGESVASIRRRGFVLFEPGADVDPEPCHTEPQCLDWDTGSAQPLRMVA